MRVSVVVSTYNRAARLPNLLAALEVQTLPRDEFEVVVVDNGSIDATPSVLAEAVARGVLRLRVVTLAKNRGPSGGRNAGWREASAGIVAFTDDDCAPVPEWLEAALDPMVSGETIVVGKTLPNPEQAHRRGPFSRTQQVTSTSHAQTCNVLYARSDLTAVGGFDESIRAKGGEDTDLAWRVADMGRQFVFAERALVYHDISTSDFGAALREAAAWVDMPRVVRVHPRRARALMHHGIFWKPSHQWALLATSGLVVAAGSRRMLPLLAVLPWLNFRLRRAPITPSRRQRLALLPHVFAIDVVETSTMVRGSIKHRTLIL